MWERGGNLNLIWGTRAGLNDERRGMVWLPTIDLLISLCEGDEPAMIIFVGRTIARERICKTSLLRASVNQYEMFRISISFAGSGHTNLELK